MNDPRSDRQSIPTIKDGDRDALAYLGRFFDDKSPGRRRIMSRLTRNHWMKVGRHWIKISGEAATSNGGHRWVDMFGKNERTPPVDNHIGAGIRNLVGRLLKKEYEPSPRPDDRKPELEAAARLYRDILLWDVEDQKFKTRVDEPIVDDLVTMGTAIGCSMLDEPNTHMHPVASTDAQKCVGCGAIFASKSWGMEDVGGIGNDRLQEIGGLDRLTQRSDEGEGGKYSLGVCPMCDEGSQLSPYPPSEKEALEGADAWGRPLGGQEPNCQALWDCVPFYEYYPENGGLVDTADCKAHGRESIRSLEWIEARIPAEKMNLITRVEPSKLLEKNPILGDPWLGMGKTAAEANVYGNHAIVRDLVIEPIPHGGDGPEDGLRWGRRIMAIGEEIVINEPLEREVPHAKGERVPIIQFAAGVAERVRGEFWGKTPVDDAVGLNIRLNRLDWMMEQMRERGISALMLPQGVDLINRKPGNTGLLNTYYYINNSDNENWTPKDAVLFGQPLTGNVYMTEREAVVASIRENLGPAIVDQGGSDGANSAKQLIAQAEQAAQKLNRMDAAHASIVTALYRHHGDIIWAFRREDGEYERKNEAGSFEKQSYRGTEILRQTKIDLQAKGTLDRSLLQAEQAEKAYDKGWYGAPGTQDQDTIDDLLELTNLPKLNNAQSIQVKRAKQAWSDFVREREVPYLDVTIQDTWIWYQVLGKLWQGDEAVKIQKGANWDATLKKLAGWERQLTRAELTDLQARPMYEGHPPAAWPGMYAEAQRLDQARSAAALAVPGAVATPPAPIPPPPPDGKFLPEDRAERILQLWRGMLREAAAAEAMQAQAVGMAAPAPVSAPSLAPVQTMVPPDVMSDSDPKKPLIMAAEDTEALLQFYAVVQECRLDAREKGNGMPQPAAPGGSRTPDGNVPGRGQGVIPAAGVGPGEAAAA